MVSGPAIYASGMKYRRLALLLLLVALGLAGCTGSDSLDGTVWQLLSAPGYETTIARLSPDFVPRLSFDDGSFVFTTTCNNPVSYTHLDVYKRQALKRAYPSS